MIEDSPAFAFQPVEAPSTPVEQISWWENIGGAELDGLVIHLLENNFDLREARERVNQAEEFAHQTGGARLPTATVQGGATRTRAPSPQGEYAWGTNYSLGVNTSWDVDVFGGLRAQHRSAKLFAEAAKLNLIATEQNVIAAFVKSWVSAATLQKRLDLAIQTAQSYETTYTLTDERFAAGSSHTSASDVLIAQQNLEASLAEIPSIETQLTTQLLIIDQQLSRLPGQTAKSFRAQLIPHTDLLAPIGLPATLLTARPDVAAAELGYHAALQDIGAARADLLPGLSLTNSLSFQNSDLSDLFDLDEYLGSIVASLTQPIFLGGRLRSNLRIEKSEAEELANAYARTALNALSEVETALAQQTGLLEELTQLKKALAAAEQSNRIAQNRYRQGLQSILSVLETQRGLSNAQLNILLNEQALLEARINLHLSLGGAWFAPGKSSLQDSETLSK